MTDPPRNNYAGGLWLLVDMSLNIWALSIVKALGLGYPPSQIVFLRALVGFFVLMPLILRHRQAFRNAEQIPLHSARVLLSLVSLTASYFAISRVPLATFTAIGFTGPLVTMFLVSILLGEEIGRRRWIAAGVALVGVLIALNPQAVPMGPGVAAMVPMIVAGSGAIVATRRLRTAHPIVMMTFYTAGLALCSAPIAAVGWEPMAAGHHVPLLLIGVFAQCAQFCFLRAHFHGQAGFLSVLSYLRLPLSVGVGYVVFSEVPGASFFTGAMLVVSAALWITLTEHRNARGLRRRV